MQLAPSLQGADLFIESEQGIQPSEVPALESTKADVESGRVASSPSEIMPKRHVDKSSQHVEINLLEKRVGGTVPGTPIPGGKGDVRPMHAGEVPAGAIRVTGDGKNPSLSATARSSANALKTLPTGGPAATKATEQIKTIKGIGVTNRTEKKIDPTVTRLSSMNTAASELRQTLLHPLAPSSKFSLVSARDRIAEMQADRTGTIRTEKQMASPDPAVLARRVAEPQKPTDERNAVNAGWLQVMRGIEDAESMPPQVLTPVWDMTHPLASRHLAQTVRAQVENGVATMQVTVHPQGLGPLTVKVSQTDQGSVNVQITAVHPATANWLHHQSAALVQALSESGVNVSGLQVGLSLGSGGSGESKAGGTGGDRPRAKEDKMRMSSVRAVNPIQRPKHPVALSETSVGFTARA